MKLKHILTSCLLLFACISNTALADDDACQFDYSMPDRPWSIMLYHGNLAETNLLQVLTLNYPSGESITALEFAKQLSTQNILRRYFQPIVTTFSIAGTVATIDDPKGPIYEFDPYVIARWGNFPWDRFVVNTYAIGWGISYDTRVSTWESHDSHNTKRLLNYLAFETTLALPRYPQYQLVIRIHHRSGVFGLYGADNAGSNFFGLGLRYFF